MKKIVFIILSLFAFVAYADNTITSKEYVDGQVSNLQTQIPAKNTNTVLTNTGTAGTIGEKKIYDASDDYASQQDALVTAGAFNTAVQNALESEFVCVEWLGDIHDNAHCLLYEVRGAYHQSKNLFDKNNRTRISGWFPRSGSEWYYNSTGYSNRIPCKPNTQYIARYNGNSPQDVLNLASTPFDDIPTENHPSVPCTNSIRFTSPTKETPVTITTGSSDKWLIVQYNLLEQQNRDMADNLQIEEGTLATPYQPYGENTYLPQNQQ